MPPSKDGSLSVADEIRRQRNRDAQQEHRKRKQMAEKARTERVARLDRVVDGMSSVVVGYVDEMLQDEVVKREPQLLDRLQSMVTQVLSLANEAGSSQTHDLSRIQRDRRSAELEEQDATNNMDRCNPQSVSLQSKVGDASIPKPSYSHTAIRENSLAAESNSTLDEVDLPGPSNAEDADVLLALTRLTDRTHGFLPPSLGTFNWSAQRPLAPDSFCFRLTQTSFTLGYLLLSKSEKAPIPVSEEERIYSSSLRGRTREDLILKMRWLIGPGQSQLQQAAELPMGGLWHQEEFSSDDLNPPELWFTTEDKSPLLSVAGVETQLLALGAHLVDQDTFELRIQRPKIELVNPGKYRALRTPDWSIINCLATGPFRPDTPMFKVRVSVTLLVANLARCAVCLMKGPGFPKSELAKAIENSIIMVSKEDPCAQVS